MIFTSLIRWCYQYLLKPYFFRRDPEAVHDHMTKVGKRLGRFRWTRRITKAIFHYQHPSLAQSYWDIHFSNPVGLSAGFDKEATLYPIMGSVGFGFAEIGTVTYGSYRGNQPPRLYRLPQSRSIVVNYGLKSQGASAVIRSLQNKPHPIPQIISIGRTNSVQASSLADGIVDYKTCLQKFIESGTGDIYEINISCPNTFGGEPFTDPTDLEKLLSSLLTPRPAKPIFIKMPINLVWDQFKTLLDICLSYKIQAVVIGNLNKNLSAATITDTIPPNLKGAASGKPTWELSNALITQTYQYCGDQIKIIGVGGIFSAADAYEKIKRGASLVELITGMIYEGPQLINEINRDLVRLLRQDGYNNIQEAIGSYYR